MDPMLHTIIAIACIYIAYEIGSRMSKKESLENYTQFLHDEGFIAFREIDGEMHFVRHPQAKVKHTEENDAE